MEAPGQLPSLPPPLKSGLVLVYGRVLPRSLALQNAAVIAVTLTWCQGSFVRTATAIMSLRTRHEILERPLNYATDDRTVQAIVHSSCCL